MSIKSRKFIILLTVCLFSFSNCYLQSILSPVAGTVMSEYGLTQAQFSRVFSSPMLPGLLLSFVSGVVIDKLGFRKPIMIAIMAGVIALAGRVFVGSYWGLFLCTFIPGIAATMLNSSYNKIFSSWFDVSAVSICLGLAMGMTSFGSAVGTGTTAMLPSLRSAFIISAIIEAVVLVMWFVFVREKEGSSDEERPAEKGKESGAIGRIFRNRNMWIVFGIAFMASGAYMIISTFLPLFLQGKGMNSVVSGAAASVFFVGYLVGCIVGPILNRIIRKTKIIMMFFALIASALMFLLRGDLTVMLLTADLAVLGFSIGAQIPICMSLPVNLADEFGRENIGTASGIAATFQLGGCVLLPSYILPFLIGDNVSVMFIIGAFLCLICAVLALLFSKKISGTA